MGLKGDYCLLHVVNIVGEQKLQDFNLVCGGSYDANWESKYERQGCSNDKSPPRLLNLVI